MTATARQWTTTDLYAALRESYPQRDSYNTVRRVLLEEVRNATGFSADRSADALLCEFWPSDGLALTGFEVKASRSDWLRELKDPSKAAAFAQYCDYWRIVAAPDVVKPDELPPMWGLMVPNAKNKLHTVRAPERNKPLPPPREFLMAVVRRAVESSYLPALQAQASAQMRQAQSAASRDNQELKRERDDLLRDMENFEKASGISLREARWNGGMQRLGDVVRAVQGVLGSGYEGAYDTISRHAAVLHRLAEQCDKAAAEVQALRVADQTAPNAASNIPTPPRGGAE